MKQPSTVFIAHTTENALVKGGGYFVFNRNSIGFSRGLDDVLESEPVDQSRIYKRGGYVSYLSEKPTNNYYNYSSEFDNAVHTKTNTVIVEEDTEVAPNGKLDADALMPLTEGTSQRFTQQSISLLGIEHTFSVYVKPKGERYVRLIYAQNASPYTVYGQSTYDLVEGSTFNTVAGEARSEYFGNGWWRISITGTALGTGNQLFRISLGDEDYEAGSLEDGVLLWGGQVEPTHSATSLVETTSSIETREGDRIYIPINDTDEITHRTYYFNLNLNDVGNSDSMITATDGTADNVVQVRSQTNGTEIAIVVKMDGELFSDVVDVGGYDKDVKVALSFSDEKLRVSVNGEVASSNTFKKLSFGSALDRIVNSNLNSTDDLNRYVGLINEVMVFPMTLSDAEMNLITTL